MKIKFNRMMMSSVELSKAFEADNQSSIQLNEGKLHYQELSL